MADSSSLSAVRPSFQPGSVPNESPATQRIVDALKLQQHIEGGYFLETDRDSFRIPNPFLNQPRAAGAVTAAPAGEDSTRAASTTIFYYLTPRTSLGAFHRNRGRTIHTLHRGRGRYLLIHADEVAGQPGKKARVETFVVGHDVATGEKLQWIVEGGKFKASFLLPDHEGGSDSEGLLISETVIPGFEYSDHDFMVPEQLSELVTPEEAEQLSWLLRKGPPPKAEEL
ncbi:DUF985 domain-containing protein [Xylona heveae TC161]|uniref:DUF985 domain-containing protein n=1 Tax=Xylona heveae (strain CBS 132557 / TC161) TaxID=1328760 RepID=A0A165JFR1_XYLHT|nr:DUF985 domain-containing protein [Xylona heveae TC161]KZF26177.1 DUF985 domain-containing protein [Xylona heveae TC161]